MISGSFAEVRAAVWRADSEEWSKGESKVAELRNYKGLRLKKIRRGTLPAESGEVLWLV